MRKKIFLLLVAISSFLNAQTSNEDIIIKINGDSIKVNIISVDEKINFNYPNEKVISLLSKNCINKIIFGSGRVETFSEKILINSIQDWEKVIITTNPEDVKCLVRKGEVRASANNTWNFDSAMVVEKKAMEKFKKEATKLKAHIILIEDQFKKGTTYWEGDVSSKYGIAYGYE